MKHKYTITPESSYYTFYTINFSVYKTKNKYHYQHPFAVFCLDIYGIYGDSSGKKMKNFFIYNNSKLVNLLINKTKSVL